MPPRPLSALGPGDRAVMPELGSYLLVGGVAFLATVTTVPLFIWLGRACNLLVQPDARRQHERPTAALGGGAMYIGFVVGFLVAWRTGWFSDAFSSSTEPWGILACATIAYAVGVIDDVKELSPPVKLAGLLLAAAVLAYAGVSIISFRVPFVDVFVLSYDLAFVATWAWLLGMTNALNLIDGLDGLAAGIVGIGATAFLLYGIRLGQVNLLQADNIGPLVAALVVGMCTGFLPWNAYPARIFMGDGGSLLLGALMAASTIAVGGRTREPFSGQTFFFYAPLVIPLVILGVPMLDSAFAVLRRARSGGGLATADKDHLHHRLVRLGHGHRRTVWILWAWTALLSAFVLYPTYNDGRGDAVVPLGLVAAALLLFTLFRPGVGFHLPRFVARFRSGGATPAGVPVALAYTEPEPGPNPAPEPVPVGAPLAGSVDLGSGEAASFDAAAAPGAVPPAAGHDGTEPALSLAVPGPGEELSAAE